MTIQNVKYFNAKCYITYMLKITSGYLMVSTLEN